MRLSPWLRSACYSATYDALNCICHAIFTLECISRSQKWRTLCSLVTPLRLSAGFGEVRAVLDI